MLNKVWQKSKKFKRRLGFLGDLVVLALGYWTLVNYVPYGGTIAYIIFLVFAGIVIFSVLWVAYVKIKQK